MSLLTIAQYEQLMTAVRDSRRVMVKSILSDGPLKPNDITALENAKSVLEHHLVGNGHSLVLDGIELNIRDELQGLKNDIKFLQLYKDGADMDLFVDYLAENKPNMEKSAFLEDVQSLLELFQRAIKSGLQTFVTDWDGTIKTYGSNYRTCTQPAYSAVILSRFVNKYAKHAAVLTAGPLSNFGILDLTTIPSQDRRLVFGGSWGREWMIGDHRVADTSDFTAEGTAALERLNDSIRRLVSTGEYRRFPMIGSGIQRKVDRITIGVQTISGDVDVQLSKRYEEAVLNEVAKIDPDQRIFQVCHLEVDMEIVLDGGKSPKTVWTKADGMQYFSKLLGVKLSDCGLMICGDTASDLPMVDYAFSVNPDRTHVVFVHPDERVRKRLAQVVPTERRCVVGCPEVLHAVMAKLLKSVIC